ncbi:hypothetical protein Poli38472_002950 [Pythium oligandrum]|uniref:Uncharacterized protein n=1 Tax=Pythium oligandrum TaxID=41045 RepID=A0A8K1C5W8_PYTOL|nr:hypothetical protein Poli38472_002950 [Pythium oligandrum]|eukprot:TMW57025.1 hypothetical protein Poli38472_002950 [Pythium oligandrum]
MARKVWFHLIDAATRGAFMDHQASSVSSDGVNDIEDLRKTIRSNYRREEPDILAHVVADQLVVYANRAAFDEENAQPLDPRSSLNSLDAQDILIVEVPTHETSQAPRFDQFEHMINVEPSYVEITQAYRATAERLKNHVKVKQVIAAIKQITEYRVDVLASTIVQEDMPFIVLESSSGTGKTQMAFNLMAHEDLEVYYLVHDQQPIRQKVYSAVATRSNTFKKCVKKDMPYIDDGAIVAISSMGSLYTFAFIWALLTGASSVSGGKTRSEVEEALRSKTESGKIVVVFLDKFPALGNQEDERKVFMLRFIQNVFRAFGIVVIMSATNGTARNLITTGSHSRSDSKALWCIMFPSLPSFQDPSVELIPSELQRLVRHSRPLFAHLALKQLGSDQLPGEKEELIEYLNILMGSLADQFGGWKEHWPDWFRTGQVCLFLCGCYVVDRKSGLLHGHFARLAEDEPFELMVGKKDLTKNDETGQWECRTMFPPVYEDALLYLTLTGGKYYNPLVDATGDPIPFHTALSEVPASFVRFDNDKQLSEDGMRLESIVGASLVVASHQDGFGGSAFPSFFLRFLYELGILESRDATVSLPKLPLMYESPTNRCVPFLAPPNQVWPNTSANELLQLGTLRRVRNEERIDFCFMGGEVTVECKDYSDPPNVKDNRIVVRFAYEWLNQGNNQWYRAYGNENWVFDDHGYMAKRYASINDVPIQDSERKFHWPQGRRPIEHPVLSELRL